jgi:hypothetical protein
MFCAPPDQNKTIKRSLNGIQVGAVISLPQMDAFLEKMGNNADGPAAKKTRRV